MDNRDLFYGFNLSTGESLDASNRHSPIHNKIRGERNYTPKPKRTDSKKIWQEYNQLTLRCVCMYCKKEYGRKDGKGQKGDSHGVCPDCEQQNPVTY